MDPILVHDVMEEKVVTISVGDRLSTVEDIMTLGGVRHMPVVRAGRLVGVVSERDLLRASLSSLDPRRQERRAFLEAIDISQVMSAPPVVVDSDTPVEEAARIMADNKIGCLPVVQGEELVGMLTETDLLRYFADLVTRDA
ncbi:MAG: CBS domain-containing protein [Deltaproteobacteria bacterium]|nr:CBS domain-containing protein [Deltaproteobacteria bacterium]MBW2373672.1 CBS domain-containing protein [Deltaproteobacteria bacterium]